MSEKGWWRLTALLGLLTAITGVITILASPASGGSYAAGFGSPIIALEFARGPTDFAAIMDGFTGQAVADRIAAFRRGVLTDFPFIIAFSTFLASFFIAAFKVSGARGWLVFALVSLLAGLSDALEDSRILAVLDAPENPASYGGLAVFASLKFVGLAAGAIGIGLWLFPERGRWKLSGRICVWLGAATLAGVFFPSTLGFVLTAVALSWVIGWVYAIRQSIR